MGKIAIVYWSGTGNTEAMANFVAEGAGGQADLFTPGEFSADLVSNYSALAFGCPSMGAEQLEEAEFEPMFEAVKPRLRRLRRQLRRRNRCRNPSRSPPLPRRCRRLSGSPLWPR